jgi:hypothetical protein
VNQLGAAAGGSLPEIALFQQQDIISPGGPVDSDAHARCAAANHNKVPWFGLRENATEHFGTVHLSSVALTSVDSP